MNIVLTRWRNQRWLPLARTADRNLAERWARQQSWIRGESCRVVSQKEWEDIRVSAQRERFLERQAELRRIRETAE